MPFKQRQIALQKMVEDFILPVLRERGPLSHEGIIHFAHKKVVKTEGVWYTRGEIAAGIAWAEGTNILSNWGDNRKFLVHILGEQDNLEPFTPSPRDYTDAYYELWDYIQLLKDNPGLAQAPTEWIEAMMK